MAKVAVLQGIKVNGKPHFLADINIKKIFCTVPLHLAHLVWIIPLLMDCVRDGKTGQGIWAESTYIKAVQQPGLVTWQMGRCDIECLLSRDEMIREANDAFLIFHHHFFSVEWTQIRKMLLMLPVTRISWFIWHNIQFLAYWNKIYV